MKPFGEIGPFRWCGGTLKEEVEKDNVIVDQLKVNPTSPFCSLYISLKNLTLSIGVGNAQ